MRSFFAAATGSAVATTIFSDRLLDNLLDDLGLDDLDLLLDDLRHDLLDDLRRGAPGRR